MDARSDSSTQELSRLRLKLEEDLVFTPHRYGNTTFYHVEMPSRSKFFRIGLAEYTFISLLDGDTTVAEAISLTARSLGSDALTEREAAAVCSWLLETGLAQPRHASQAARLHAADRRQRARKFAGRLNPFWLKLPLGRPDRLLQRLLPLAGWMHSLSAILLGLALCGVAAATVAMDWDRFLASSVAIFSPANWIWLGAAWVLLKTAHELGHGLVCRKYGGEVREFGIILILFVPVPYVDVTSSWRFRSRWQRIHTSAAGMYVELVMAAIAALLFSGTDSAVAGHLLYSIMLMASVTTVVFNANPLMRFDGYYIATDLFEIPNLYGQASRYVTGLVRRVLLGVPAATRLGWDRKDLLLRLYGLAACGWRVLVCASLAIAASVMFHGAGLAIAVLGLAAWLLPAALRSLRTMWEQHQLNPMSTVRAMVVSGVLAGSVAALWWLPWPGAGTAPGVIEHKDSTVVRAESAGFVTAIHVRDGQLVAAGDLLLELSNDELATEHRDLELAIEQCHTRRRIHLEKMEHAAAQVERENERALAKRLAERQRQITALTVHAPVAGRVMARRLDALEGTHLQEGAEILVLGDDRHKQLRVSIAQEDTPAYRPLVGKPVRFRLRSMAVYEGRLTRIIPRASKELPHAALAAPLGGPLAVTKTESQEQEDSYELTLPRFTGIVELPRADGAQHQAGEFGYVTIRPQQAESIGHTLSRRVLKWVEDKVQQAKSRWREA